jgi:hypothetical protein
MNLAELQSKLLAAARRGSDERVPYAFEKRVMARLGAVRRTDEWALWARALWSGAAVCTGITLVIGAWSWSPGNDSHPALSFAQDLEQTILVSVDDGDTTW